MQTPLPEENGQDLSYYSDLLALTTDHAFAYRVLGPGRYELEWRSGEFDWAAGHGRDGKTTEQDWARLIHPHDRDRLASLMRAVEANQPVQAELRLVPRDRRVRWVRFRAKPVWDPSAARVVRVVGAVQDITEYKRVQHALRQSERRLQAMFDATPLAVMVLREDGVVLDWNSAAERTFGWKAHEVIGRVLPIVPEDKQDEFHRKITRTLGGQNVMGLETQLRHRDGRLVDVAIWSAPVPGGENQPRQLITLTADITDRRRIEHALRQSEDRFHTLFESAQDAIFVYTINPDGTPGPFYEANAEACRRYGYSREEFLTMSVVDLYASDTPAQRFTEAMRNIRERGAVMTETVHLTRGGRRIPVEVHAHQVDLSGEPVVLSLIRDISVRKQAEQQLQLFNETLERRVAERTAVAEHRAAQLRTLAAELTQAEQRERRRLADLLHDHLQQLLVAARIRLTMLRDRATESEVADALEQVDDLMGQSIDASRSLSMELAPPVLYDMGLAAALEWLGRSKYEKYGLTVYVSASRDAEPAAEDVSVLIFQAVRELLFNVVKHAGVKEAWLSMDAADADQVRVVVEDRGSGFDTARARLNNDAEGGGLGLFSLNERLQMLGGRVEIDSTPGGGTRVSLYAPRSAGAATDEAEPPPEATQPAAPPEPAASTPILASVVVPRTGRIRVLLADDHKVVREGIAGLLRRESDIEVIAEVSDGQEALEAAHQLRPDVVILDVTMPRLNGIETTRRITRELPGVAVVGLSFHEEQDVAVAMREAGACAYLIKAGPSAELLAAVRKCRKSGKK